MDFQNFNHDFGQGQGSGPGGSDMKRLIMTVLVVTVAVFAMNFAMRPSPEELEAKEKADAEKAALLAESNPVDKPKVDPVETAPDQPVVDTPAQPERTATFTADVAKTRGGETEGVRGGYTADLTTKGGQLKGFELTGYTDNDRFDPTAGSAPNVALASHRHKGAGAFTFVSRGGDFPLGPEDDFALVSDDAGEVRFSREHNGITLDRRYKFHADNFVFEHILELRNNSGSEKRVVLDMILVGEERPGERDEGGFFGAYSDKLATVCKSNDGREKWESSGIEETERLAGQVAYAGIDRHFFLGAIVNKRGETEGCEANGWKIGESGRFGVETRVHYKEIVLAAGQSATFEHEAFFGPKQLGLLQEAGYELDENVDFGWFGIISKPMLWLLVKMNDFTNNFGWAIILLTLLIKALTFPLTQKSYVSMQQMKTLQPEIKKLQKKYAADKAALGQAQMALYKERGVNPMAGCLPMVVQMPIWFALYRTLWNSVELYQQPFIGWIVDLSQPDQFPIGGFPLLPILVGALMFASTALQPTPQDQPQMKYVMWGMPIFFSLLMLQMPSGLSVYMITNSSLTMIQQFYIRRRYGAPAPSSEPDETPKEEKKKSSTTASSKSKPSSSKKKKRKKK